MKKRILAMLMAAALCVSSVPFSVMADVDSTVESSTLVEETADDIDDNSTAILEDTKDDDQANASKSELIIGSEENEKKDAADISAEAMDETEPDADTEDALIENTEETVTKDVMVAADYGLNNPRVSDFVNDYGKNDVTATWDSIWFGSYPQSDSTGATKEPIKWRVLSVNGDDAFILADQNLDYQPYNTEHAAVTWETCTLRTWLNNDFYSSAFNNSEQNSIKTTTLVNEDTFFTTENYTSDRVYLLSVTEASARAYGFPENYSMKTNARQARNTEYVKAQGAHRWSQWWLRDPGDVQISATYVSDEGYLDKDGIPYTSSVAIRPALHIDLSSSVWSYAGTVSSEGDGSGTVTPSPTPTVAPTPTTTEEINMDIGNNIAITIPDDVPIIGGGDLKLDLTGIPVEFVAKGSIFKIGIGTRNLADTNDDEWFSWKKFVEKQDENIGKAKDVLKKLKDPKTGIASMGWSVKPEIKVYGYAEGTYNGKKIQSFGGQVILEMKAKAQKEWQTFVVSIPVVLKASGEVGVKAGLSVGLDFGSATVYLKGGVTLTLPKIKASAGVGIAYVADVSFYGSGKNEVKLTANGVGNDKISASLNGEIGVSAKALCLSFEKKLLSGEWEYYSNEEKTSKKAMYNAVLDDDELISVNASEYNIERTEESVWKTSALNSTISNSEYAVILEDVYNAADPILLATESGRKVLIYTADITERSSGNHTAVVYSICEKGSDTWSDPVILDDDGTADFYPSAAIDGEKVYVAWSNSKTTYTSDEVNEGDFLTTLASDLEIETAELNTEDMSVSRYEITDDTYMDTRSAVSVCDGNVTVAWIQNSGNDAITGSGNNAIYVSDLTGATKTKYEEFSRPISGLAIGNISGEEAVSFVVNNGDDTVNNLLYAGKIDGTAIVLDEGQCYHPVFAPVNGNSELLWYASEGEGVAKILCSADLQSTKTLLSDDVIVSQDFTYAAGDNADLLICSGSKTGDEDGKDIYGYVVNDGIIMQPVNITDDQGYATCPGTVYENGNWIVSYLRTTVTLEQSSDALNEKSDICVSTVTPDTKLELSDISYDPESVIPGEDLEVTATVHNNGLESDQNYTVTILAGDTVVGEETIGGTIRQGADSEMTVMATLPDSFKAGDELTFRVADSSGNVNFNGEIKEQTGKTDLQLELNETDTDVVVTVTNISAFETDGKLNVSGGSGEADVLKSYDLGKIAGGASEAITITKDELKNLDAEDDSRVFETRASEEELFYSNNTGYVYLGAMSEDKGETPAPTERPKPTATPTSRVTQQDGVSSNNTIKKKTNPLNVKVKTVKVKYSKLKKKKQTVKANKAFTVSKAQGKVTYKLATVKKAKFKKYFKVSKSGKITVKKGLKKGTYKLKVNVTAAGNANYEPLTKTVTVKVKVK